MGKKKKKKNVYDTERIKGEKGRTREREIVQRSLTIRITKDGHDERQRQAEEGSEGKKV